MKTGIALLTQVLLLLCGWAWAGNEDTNQPPPVLRLELDLVDGSHIIGIPKIESVPVQTSYAKVDIPLKQIGSLKLADDHETASLDFVNGDKLKGVVALKPLELTTVFGPVKIGIEHLREIVVSTGEGLLGLLARDLVLYYSFDPDEENKVTDKSGKKNDGRLHGATWTAQGKAGGAYSFNGRDSYIEIGDKDSLDPHLDSMTIAAWVKTTGNIHARIFSKGSHGGSQDGYALMEYGSRYGGRGTAALLFTAAGVEHRVDSDNPIGDGEWKYLVGVINRTGNMEIYVNGIKGSASVSIVDHASVDVGKQSHEARIGVSCWPDGPQRLDEYWHGTIDEVMVFNRALSPEEIQALYKAR